MVEHLNLKIPMIVEWEQEQDLRLLPDHIRGKMDSLDTTKFVRLACSYYQMVDTFLILKLIWSIVLTFVYLILYRSLP